MKGNPCFPPNHMPNPPLDRLSSVFWIVSMYGMPIQPILVSRSLLLPLPFSLTIRTLPSNDPVCLEAGYTDFSGEMSGISIMMLKFFWNRIPLQICATIRAVFFMIIHVSSRPSLIGFGSVCLLKWHFFLIENAVPVKTPITSD